jgi:unsaturated rhamnogalacturonyl hydrolase
MQGLGIAEGMLLLGCSSPGRHGSTIGSVSASVEPEAVRSAMTRVADSQLERLAGYPPDDWVVAPFWVGLLTFAPLSRTPARYLESARANGRRNGWQPGPEPFLADDLAITQSYFLLYAVDRDRAEIAPALVRFDALLGQRFDEPLEFSHDTALREWVWCDALFMAPPALALASHATGDPRYRELMQRLWWKTTDFLYDRETQLYYRDSRFFGQRERNGAKVFWSRGNGWVLAGLARVLQYLPPGDPGRGRFEALFRAMAAKVAALQRPDGYWRASLLDPDSWPTPETSGTAFFTYALAWGVNEGLLERRRYESAVRKGWDALVRAVQPDGRLGYVQRPDDRPAGAEPDHTEPYGTGAFLLAGSEVYRLAVRAGQ